MAIDSNTFNGLIKQKKIDNIYRFFGPELGEREDAYKALKGLFAGGEEFIEIIYYGNSDIDGSAFLENLQTSSLFGEKRIILVKDYSSGSSDLDKIIESAMIPLRFNPNSFEKLKSSFKSEQEIKDLTELFVYDDKQNAFVFTEKKKGGNGRKKIYDLLKPRGMTLPDKDTLIVLCSDEMERSDSISKYLSNNQTVIFWELFENQKTAWLKAEFKKNGLFIDDDSVRLFLELVENNKQQLRYEIDKIAISLRGSTEGTNSVTSGFLEDFFAHTKEENPFNLYNAILEKDTNRAIDIVRVLFYGEDRTIVSGISWAHRRFLNYLDLVINQYRTSQEALNSLGVRGKKQQAEMESGRKNYTVSHIAYMTKYLADLDHYSKTLPDELLIMKYEQFVLNYIRGNQGCAVISGDIL